jgi:hypothetical protein
MDTCVNCGVPSGLTVLGHPACSDACGNVIQGFVVTQRAMDRIFGPRERQPEPEPVPPYSRKMCDL